MSRPTEAPAYTIFLACCLCPMQSLHESEVDAVKEQLTEVSDASWNGLNFLFSCAQSVRVYLDHQRAVSEPWAIFLYVAIWCRLWST